MKYRDLSKLIPLQEMPPAWGGFDIYMKKRVERTVVPSREKRLEKIGVPKVPGMGGIVPKTIPIPEADDLLGEMKVRHCNIDCRCPPCRRGDCNNCHVAAAERSGDIDNAVALVNRYRSGRL